MLIVQNHATYFGHGMASTAYFVPYSVEEMDLIKGSASYPDLYDTRPHNSGPEIGGFISGRIGRDCRINRVERLREGG